MISGTLLTVKEASEVLGLTEQQVRSLCREGRLNSVKVGQTWMLHLVDLQVYASSHSCGHVTDQVAKEKGMVNGPIAISFFSGAMGLDIGIESEGFDVRLCCEVDSACRKTIRRNRPHRAMIGDIRNYSASDVRVAAGLKSDEDIDLVVGGPPCQAFSTAGRRKGLSDTRGNLLTVYLKMIFGLCPKYAVIENVRGILSAQMSEEDYLNSGLPVVSKYPGLPGGVMRFVVDQFRANGYEVTFNLYNAANFGTPQLRERVVVIASRNGNRAPYLKPTHSEKGDQGLLPWVTLREAIADLSDSKASFIPFPEKRLRYYQLLKAGENWRNLPSHLQPEAMGNAFGSGGGKSGFYRRLSWTRPSPTLLTHPAMPATDLAHPEENRPLSIEEYKRIQQFPDDWALEGTLLEKYRQVGNAVPVGLGRAIARLIRSQMSPLVEGERFSNFRFSRYSGTDIDSWERQWARNAAESQQVCLL